MPATVRICGAHPMPVAIIKFAFLRLFEELQYVWERLKY